MTTDEFRPAASDIKGQTLPYPARQSDMQPQPDSDPSNYRAAGKMAGKVAPITGADSGIGRAVAVAFAMEGASVAIFYNTNDGDAHATRTLVEGKGGRCLALKGDVRVAAECRDAVAKTVAEYGALDVLVNNAAFQSAHHLVEVTGGKMSGG